MRAAQGEHTNSAGGAQDRSENGTGAAKEMFRNGAGIPYARSRNGTGFVSQGKEDAGRLRRTGPPRAVQDGTSFRRTTVGLSASQDMKMVVRIIN